MIIFLTNPRLVFSDEAFLLAQSVSNGPAESFAPLSSTPHRCGILLQNASTEEPTLLLDKLPEAARTQAPPGFDPYDKRPPFGLLQLTLQWKRQGVEQWISDRLGYALGIPSIEDIGLSELRFFSPTVAGETSVVLHKSLRVSVTLGDEFKDLTVIPKTPGELAEGASAQEKRLFQRCGALRQAFGLPKDFAGIIFGGGSMHWLDDNQQSSLVANIETSAYAFSGEALDSGPEKAGWYTDISFEDRASKTALLGLLRGPFKLKLSIAGGDLRYASVSGICAPAEDSPAAWLAGKGATVSLIKYASAWALELALVGSAQRVLHTYGEDSFGGALTSVASAMVLGPIVIFFSSPDRVPEGVASDPKQRGYFVRLADTYTVGQLGVVVALSDLFKDALSVQEMRVVGVYLRHQPKSVRDPKASGYETAILCDYEIDYEVDMPATGVKTSRPVSTCIDGSGFSVSDEGVHWVQVPSGLHELALDDPGLWNIGGLGKVLRVARIALKRGEDGPVLLVQLRLAANIEGLKADDFQFAMPLKGEGARIVAYPSSVELNIAKKLKGKGTFNIREAEDAVEGGHPASAEPERDIAGSIHVTLLGPGWRFSAGARVTKKKPDASSRGTTALTATATIEFPTWYPLGASGLGIKGLEGLYAKHFARKEKEAPPDASIPPTLQWLADAVHECGGVAPSATEYSLWEPRYEHFAYGFGTVLSIIANDYLLNLNAMMIQEVPGERLRVFCKVNIVRPPQNNKEQDKELVHDILGVLEVDVERRKFMLDVLASASFKDLLTVRVPLAVHGDLSDARKWQAWMGRIDDPAIARFEWKWIQAAASFYLMASGDGIERSKYVAELEDLHGLAVALGFHAHAQIGTGSVRLRISFDAHLAVAIHRALYVYGQFTAAGEMKLWRFTIGVSADLDIRYVLAPEGVSLVMNGHVCGGIKVFRHKYRACVNLSIAAREEGNLELPHLIERCTVQGNSTFQSPSLDNVPLDGVLAISMVAPPEVRDAKSSAFVLLLPQPDGNVAVKLGTSEEVRHALLDITLVKDADPHVNILDARTQVRWWSAQPASAGSQQPISTTLALRTQCPIAQTDGLPDTTALCDWLKQILDDPCAPVLPAQRALYSPTTGQRGAGPNWALCALPAHRLERGAALPALDVTAHSYRFDQLSAEPASCVVVPVAGERRVAFKLTAIWMREAQSELRMAPAGGFSSKKEDSVHVLIALATGLSPSAGNLFTWYAAGRSQPVQVIAQSQVTGPADLEPLRAADSQWVVPLASFLRLKEAPQFSALDFWVVEIAPPSATDDDQALVVTLRIPGEKFPVVNALLGPVLCMSAMEREREARAQDQKRRRLEELRDYLSDAEAPLLEPDTPYTLTVASQRRVDGGKWVQLDNRMLSFKTTAHPPRSLVDYLYCSFPRHDAPCHFYGDLLGFALRSNEILRILGQFDASIRITLTRDDYGAVDSGASHDWTRGRTFAAKDLLDLGHAFPELDRRPISSLPSRVADELRRMDIDLSCLAPLPLPAGTWWIGLRAKLEALRTYRLAVEVLHADGRPWAWPEDTGQPFLELRFRTSAYQSGDAFAAAISKGLRRDRLIDSLPSLPFQAEPSSLSIMPEKALEDALAAVTGERSTRSQLPQFTVLWRNVEGDGVLRPEFVVIEGDEPLLRDVQITTAQETKTLVPYFGPASTAGVKAMILSSSRCAAVLKLSQPSQTLTWNLEDVAVDNLPRGVSSRPALQLELRESRIASTQERLP
ncbi:MAG: hypothetical protein SXG53_02405 [Pseudomonadota bacterium]|nr:hypothetical protein [Pseudomonadota bacterium]